MAVSDSNSVESKSSSRKSSSKSSASGRPKLIRSSATAPCLATSNACRSDLAQLESSSRASVLLSRVASYSSSKTQSLANSEECLSSCRGTANPRRRAGYELKNAREEKEKNLCAANGLYFSFPSFEDFTEEQSGSEKT